MLGHIVTAQTGLMEKGKGGGMRTAAGEATGARKGVGHAQDARVGGGDVGVADRLVGGALQVEDGLLQPVRTRQQQRVRANALHVLAVARLHQLEGHLASTASALKTIQMKEVQWCTQQRVGTNALHVLPAARLHQLEGHSAPTPTCFQSHSDERDATVRLTAAACRCRCAARPTQSLAAPAGRTPGVRSTWTCVLIFDMCSEVSAPHERPAAAQLADAHIVWLLPSAARTHQITA